MIIARSDERKRREAGVNIHHLRFIHTFTLHNYGSVVD
jgi:hypothetical protein